MRLDAGVDHQRTAAAPVFLLREGVDAVDIGGRIAAGEDDPEEVVQRARREVAVVHHDDQRKAVDGVRNGARSGRTARSLRPPRRAAATAWRPGDGQHAGQTDARLAKPVGQLQIGGHFRRQVPHAASRPPRSRPSSLRSARCRCSPACRSWCASENADRAASPRAAARAGRNAGMSWTSSCGSSSRAAINRYLASDNCPCPRMALACVSSSCGRRSVSYGVYRSLPIGQQQRMHAGRIDGVHGVDAGNHLRNDRAGQLVDQLAEHRILLRRPAHHGERPDRAVAVIDVLDAKHGEIVRQAVVAQMVAERAFGQLLVRDRPCPQCRSRPRHRSAASAGCGSRRLASRADHRDAMAGQRTGKRQLGHAFRQRHHGGQHHRRRSADEDVHAERFALAQGRRVVDADRAVHLVVQADFPVGLVAAAGQLNAVHAEVRLHQPRLLDVFRVDLRQRDERPAVVGPRFQLRQLADRRLVGQHRAARAAPRQHREADPAEPPGNASASEAAACGSIFSSIIRRTRSQVSRNRKRACSSVPNRFETIGKRQFRTRCEQQRRTAGRVDAALDLGRLQMRVDLVVDADQDARWRSRSSTHGS